MTYQELLPMWKAFCRSGPSVWVPFLHAEKIPYSFIYRDDGHIDCVVRGIMLFTYELGIED